MEILELLDLAHLDYKRASGDEYHSPCPSCGGKDRFIVWNDEGRYWCRQCERNGDMIQFCRDFLGMSFKEARDYVRNN